MFAPIRLEQLAEATRRGDADGVRRLLFIIAGSSLDLEPAVAATTDLGPDGVHGTPIGIAPHHHRHGSAEFKSERTGA